MCYDPLGTPYGRFHAVGPEGGAGPAQPAGGDETTHREGFMTARLTVDPQPTLYSRVGDVPWWVLGLLLVGWAVLRGGRARGTGAESPPLAEIPDPESASPSEGIG
jgi:hypothetical protein